MGGNQSSVESFSQNLNSKDWRKGVGNKGKNTYTHVNDQSFVVEENFVSVGQTPLDDITDMYKLRKNHPQLVAAHHLKIKDNSQLCSSSYNGELYLEQIPLTLSDVTDIPFPDAYHLYDQSLKGFNILANQYESFSINEDCIGINNKSQVKVWHSHEFDKVQPVSRTSNSENMLLNLINILQANIDAKTKPVQQPSIGSFIYKNNENIGFPKAISKFHEYVNIYNEGRIPDKLFCVGKVGGIGSIKKNFVTQTEARAPRFVQEAPVIKNPSYFQSTQEKVSKSQVNIYSPPPPPQYQSYQPSPVGVKQSIGFFGRTKNKSQIFEENPQTFHRRQHSNTLPTENMPKIKRVQTIPQKQVPKDQPYFRGIIGNLSESQINMIKSSKPVFTTVQVKPLNSNHPLVNQPLVNQPPINAAFIKPRSVTIPKQSQIQNRKTFENSVKVEGNPIKFDKEDKKVIIKDELKDFKEAQDKVEEKKITSLNEVAEQRSKLDDGTMRRYYSYSVHDEISPQNNKFEENQEQSSKGYQKSPEKIDDLNSKFTASIQNASNPENGMYSFGRREDTNTYDKLKTNPAFYESDSGIKKSDEKKSEEMRGYQYEYKPSSYTYQEMESRKKGILNDFRNVEMKESIMEEEYKVDWDPEILADLQAKIHQK